MNCGDRENHLKSTQYKSTLKVMIYSLVIAFWSKQLFYRHTCWILNILRHFRFTRRYWATIASWLYFLTIATTVAQDMRSHLSHLKSTTANEPMTTRRWWGLPLTIHPSGDHANPLRPATNLAHSVELKPLARTFKKTATALNFFCIFSKLLPSLNPSSVIFGK